MKKPAEKSVTSLSGLSKDSKERISALVTEVSSYIEKTHLRIASGINYEMVQLYWSIGDSVRTEILHDERASYGEYIVVTLSRELTARYGNGFSEKNLRKMVQFSEFFPDKDIVATLSGQFTTDSREENKHCSVFAKIQMIEEMLIPGIVSLLSRQSHGYQKIPPMQRVFSPVIPPEQYGF